MDFVHNTKKSSTNCVSNKKLKNVPKKNYSHLYFQDKHLKNIPKFQVKEDVLVLYLYNNEITSIENLDGFRNLASLYLQNNQIDVMENLKHLTGLKKLFIGHNKIQVLEGLENMKCLQELHIEKQTLPDNNPLCVDPRTIICISETLQILNISHNNLTSLCQLSPLKNLKIINASFNDLDDILDICQTVHNWYYLVEAMFTGNPFTKRYRYKEEIIAKSHYLKCLDGKVISDITRSFIKKLEEEKILHGSKQSVSVNIPDVYPNLPKNYPLSFQKAASASLLKTAFKNPLDNLSSFDDENGAYIAWKTLPKRKSCLKTPHHIREKINAYKNRVGKTNFPRITDI